MEDCTSPEFVYSSGIITGIVIAKSEFIRRISSYHSLSMEDCIDIINEAFFDLIAEYEEV